MLKTLLQFKNDFSISSLVTGFIIVLVGMTSSAVLVIQAAQVAGATVEQSSSWLGSLCLVMGILTIGFSLKYKTPYLFAWSTAGAAILITGVKDFSYAEIMGVFIFGAALTLLSGVTGLFEKMMNRIPKQLAAGILAGVLIPFCFKSFLSFQTQPILILAMFLTYVVCKRFYPKSLMLIVLIVGILVSKFLNILNFSEISFSFTHPHLVAPEFTFTSILSLGVPLFIVTMASQNLTGIAILKKYEFEPKTSLLMTSIGFANLLTAPFGGYQINLAAITAALAMGPECHPDKNKRYSAAVVAGIIYLMIGLIAGTITALFASFPKELILGICGFALLSTVSSSIQSTLNEESHREAGFITFIVAASGFSFLGVGSAFWAIVIGTCVQVFMSMTSKKIH